MLLAAAVDSAARSALMLRASYRCYGNSYYHRWRYVVAALLYDTPTSVTTHMLVIR